MITKNIMISTFAISLILVGFLFTFLSAPFILNSVYGITPRDPGYTHDDNKDGIMNTPYQDFIANGCMTKPFNETDETIVFDTNGLVELGMVWFDPNTCFDMAMGMSDNYIIDSVVKDSNDQMIITLTKKNNTNGFP